MAAPTAPLPPDDHLVTLASQRAIWSLSFSGRSLADPWVESRARASRRHGCWLLKGVPKRPSRRRPPVSGRQSPATVDLGVHSCGMRNDPRPDRGWGPIAARSPPCPAAADQRCPPEKRPNGLTHVTSTSSCIRLVRGTSGGRRHFADEAARRGTTPAHLPASRASRPVDTAARPDSGPTDAAGPPDIEI